MNRPYLSFLLRMWQTGDPANPHWFASLEDPHTRQTITLHSLPALWEYLQKITNFQNIESHQPTDQNQNPQSGE